MRAGAKTEGLGIETPIAMQAAIGVLRDCVQTHLHTHLRTHNPTHTHLPFL